MHNTLVTTALAISGHEVVPTATAVGTTSPCPLTDQTYISGRVPWIYAERAVIHLVAGKATTPPGAEWAPRSRLDDSRDTL
jgi:hypothetical protein